MGKLDAISQPRSLTRLAYEKLRDSILSGDLTPGEVYNEMALAKQMGVSRTPVREALLELSSQGLVTFLPRKGVQVNYFSERDVEEVFELRELIELAALDRAAAEGGDEDWARIAQTLLDGRDALARNDLDAFLLADRAFHHSLAEVSGNRRMHALLDNLRDIVHVMSSEAVSRAARMDEVLLEHERILELLERGDAGAAHEAMARHLALSRQAVLARRGGGEAGLA